MGIFFRNKTQRAERIGTKALSSFEKAHVNLIYAAGLAEDHAVEHDAVADAAVTAADDARRLAASHRRSADKLAELLGYDEDEAA